MLKRILLCTIHHSEVTPSQFASSFSFRSQRERLMAAKYSTLVVVLMLSLGALAQNQQPVPDGEGSPQYQIQIDSGINGGSSFMAWMNQSSWDAAVNNSVGLSGATADSVVSNQEWSDYAGGNIPLSVLTSGPMRGARAAVNGMGDVAAIGGATVAGGPMGGAMMLMNLFPSLAPGASCIHDNPPCSVGIIYGAPGEPGGGWGAASGEEVMGRANAIAIRKFGASFDQLAALPGKERAMFLASKFHGAEGFTAYTGLTAAFEKAAAGEVDSAVGLREFLGAMKEMRAAGMKLEGWVQFMENGAIDQSLPNAQIH
jgi:hypothetical protein